jgi:hypothetical protein
MAEQPILGEFDSYESLLTVLRSRVAQLDVSGECLDQLIGWPSRYAQKLLGTNPSKRLGVKSLADLFPALGIKGHVVVDEAALARVSSRLIKRKYSVVPSGSTYIHIKLSRRHMRKIQEKGRAVRFARMTPAQRSALGRKLANHRWAKVRSASEA